MKNKLTCSICLKEFKSLPALNGHMRSHGGVRASPNFKQVAVHFTSVFDSLLSMLMFACFATLCFAVKTCSPWRCFMSHPVEVEIHRILLIYRPEVSLKSERVVEDRTMFVPLCVSAHYKHTTKSWHKLLNFSPCVCLLY